MLLRARTLAFARATALLVAAMLTGTPRVLAVSSPVDASAYTPGAPLDEPQERERADLGATLATPAADAELPLDRSAAGPQALSPSEDDPERVLSDPDGLDPFISPASDHVVAGRRHALRGERARELRQLPREPEPPRPRAALA